MATRCSIKITKEGKEDKWLYHHWDGYPEGVGEELDEFMKEGGHSDIPEDLATELNDWDSKYELDEGPHDDIDYLYIINLYTHTITCLSVDGEAWDINDGKLIYTQPYPTIPNPIIDNRIVMDKTFALRFKNFVDKCEVFCIHSPWMYEEWNAMKHYACTLLDYQIQTCTDEEEQKYFAMNELWTNTNTKEYNMKFI